MALTSLFWNARSLLRKTQEFQEYLRDVLPSIVGVCETWLPSHIALTLPGYNIYRRDRQGRGGGVLLALRGTLIHSELPFPQRQGGHLEVVAARVGIQMGWLTVAVCYDPSGTASSQEYEHYLAALPSPVLIMGDFNAHHQYWDPDLPLHQKNAAGVRLFQILMDSPHLSLLSPPGMPTRFHPHTGNTSVLDLYIGNPALHNSTFSVGPYMGSDHVPLLGTFPQAPPRPHPGCLPRWKLTSDTWPRYEEALHPPANLDHDLEEAAASFSKTLKAAGKAAFHFVTHRTPRKPGKPWWNDECAQAVLARRQAWNKWRKTPTLQAGMHYRKLDAICAKTIMQAKRNAFGIHCSSLSFASSPKRTWDFLHAMEGRKARPPLPLTNKSRDALDDPQKAGLLADHFHLKIGLRPPQRPPAHHRDALANACTSPDIPELSQPFTLQELEAAMKTLKPGKTAGHDHSPTSSFCTSHRLYKNTSYKYTILVGEPATSLPAGNSQLFFPYQSLKRTPHHQHHIGLYHSFLVWGS